MQSLHWKRAKGRSMTQATFQFGELEPCKHCGGTAMEQWRLTTDWKGDEYIAIVMMCSGCTFETCDQVERSPDGRARAVRYWNAGVIQQLAHPGGMAMAKRGPLAFDEAWEFETH